MRNLDFCVISDVHLGTYGCHAAELVEYLQSINPKTLVLNGDILDIWQFRKKYFPKDHMDVLLEIRKKLMNGTKVFYVTGNHDELLREFSDLIIGDFQIVDKMVFALDKNIYWIFHGDIFDTSVNYAKWIARLGGKGYDWLIRINRFINLINKKMGKPPRSFSKKIKAKVKKAVKFMGDFEKAAIELAIEQKYDYVICGHIHNPIIKEVYKNNEKVTYMNSGDWVESLTALEFKDSKWSIFKYEDIKEYKKPAKKRPRKNVSRIQEKIA